MSSSGAGVRPSAARSLLVTVGPSLLADGAAGWGLLSCAAAVARGRRPGLLARAATIGVAAYGTAGRAWLRNWGATPDEVRGPWPGDELVPQPSVAFTRAVTVDVPGYEAWRWVVQIGQGRGGLYSYDWLENLAGLEIHSVDRVVRELQRLEPGDAIPLSPGGREMLVERVEPPGRPGNSREPWRRRAGSPGRPHAGDLVVLRHSGRA